MVEETIMKNAEKLPGSTTDDGESIACPWCGETWADLWDYDWTRECIDMECPYCDKSITLCAEFSVDYTCYAREPAAGDIK